ncbi:MAG: cytochrome b [Magnetococcales bacterium]|nr:cytochrome b [Magnetococcales bacterium]
MWKNSSTRYGFVARLLHWSMFGLLSTLIVLGLWMTGLTYYDPWYQRAPAIHEGLGLLSFLLFVFRVGWRRWDPPPACSLGMPAWEINIAHWTHRVLYVLMGIIPVTGYLITTAKGLPVVVFGWFSVPALLPRQPGMEDLAGSVHLALGLTLAGLACLHMMAALKHHFIDKDDTLAKMVPFLSPPAHTCSLTKEE